MLANLASVEDVLYYAIGREIEANVFYNLLSQSIEDPNVRVFCTRLASEELEHKARLELEIMKLGKVSKPVLASGKAKTTRNPLDYMLDMAQVLQMDLEDVLILAMEKEKNSFHLYIDLISRVEDESCRSVLTDIAEEEARHKISFELEYEKLTADSEQGPI